MRSLSAQLLSQCVQPSWHQLTRTVCVCTDTSKYETELSQVVGLAYTSCSNCTRPPFLECRCQWPGIVNAPLLGLSRTQCPGRAGCRGVHSLIRAMTVSNAQAVEQLHRIYSSHFTSISLSDGRIAWVVYSRATYSLEHFVILFTWIICTAFSGLPFLS